MGANFSTLGKGSFKDTTPLGMAADRSWISDDHYADDNTKNSGYRSWTVTPLGVIKVLLEAGADPNIPDSKGRYPLHAVVHSYFFDECSKDVFAKGPKCADKYRMVEPLLEHGANPNIGVPSDSSYPPTLLSIVKWEKARKLLIKYGAE